MGQSTSTTNEAVKPPPSTQDEVLRRDFVGGFRPERRQRRNRRHRRRPQRKCQRIRRMKWETERHVCGSLWWFDLVEGLDQGVTFLGLSVLGDGVTGPSLVPGHVGGGVDHVVTDPTGDWDEWNLLGVVSDLLQVVGYFLLDFVETLFTVFWLGGVHLVDGDNHLLDTKGESEKGVFTGLTVL